MHLLKHLTATAVVVAALTAGSAGAQIRGITLPPSGDNQVSKVVQYIGPVQVAVKYSSPDVTGPQGEDRRGKIWGGLVPYGLSDLGFGPCKECPWRAGANENTIFTVSHDVKIEGKALAAGSYGLHMIPGKDEWVVIFSKDSTSWGSYTYNPAEDALRVTVKPEKAEYNEWLTFEFTDRDPDHATLALKWEELAVPFNIKVENVNDLYLAQIRQELRSYPGFTSENWRAAARFCLDNKINTAEALTWAETAVNGLRGGQGEVSFNTLMTLADAQEANGKTAEAAASRQKALADPSASVIDIHMYGRTLQLAGKNKEALAIFEMNAKKNPGKWPVELGLARAYSATGDHKKALEHAKLAVKTAPNEGNRKNAEMVLKQIEEAAKKK
ncbi:MAG: DUF2911 domain-containing protein [Thermoanaerobaculia bacterium]|nr:DUF2911 domain-containing protein [Thermoanaerobaculia bacterium]